MSTRRASRRAPASAPSRACRRMRCTRLRPARSACRPAHPTYCDPTTAPAPAGSAAGVTMTTAPSRAFVDAAGAPAFGANRTHAGLMGGMVFDVALACVRNAVEIVRRDDLALQIVAVGGVCSPERARAFIDAGA